MQLKTWLAVGAGLTALTACGDHYEGGGRRSEVPTDASSSSGGGPKVGLGDGMNTKAGSSYADEGGADGADVAGSGGFAGALFAGGTGGT